MDGSLSSVILGHRHFQHLHGYPPVTQPWSPVEESREELHLTLLHTTVELESARAEARTQSKLHEARVQRLEQLLDTAQRERDEARRQCFQLQEHLSCLLQSNSAAAATMPSAAVNAVAASTPAVAQERDSLSCNYSGSMGSPPQPKTQLPPWTLDDLEKQLDLQHHQQKEEEIHVSSFDTTSPFQLDIIDSLDADVDGAIMMFTSNNNNNNNNNNSSTPPVLLQNPLKRPSPSPSQSPSLSPSLSPEPQLLRQVHLPEPPEADIEVMLRSLPERGKLLQAVMQAGPLLHNLLLAGPLPQWRHPPPVLEPVDIPKVSLPMPSQAQAQTHAPTPTSTLPMPSPSTPLSSLCCTSLLRTPSLSGHMSYDFSCGSPLKYAKIH